MRKIAYKLHGDKRHSISIALRDSAHAVHKRIAITIMYNNTYMCNNININNTYSNGYYGDCIEARVSQNSMRYFIKRDRDYYLLKIQVARAFVFDAARFSRDAISVL